MALLNTIDPQHAASTLAGWLPSRVNAEHVHVSDVIVPQAGGFSMTTVLFRAEWEADGQKTSAELVARIAPTGMSLFQFNDLEREFRLFSALNAGTAVRVPRVHWYEPDPAVLGAPFIVMEHVHGLVPTDDPPYPKGGWVADLPAAERPKLYDGLLRALADVHAVDWRALDLGPPAPAEGTTSAAHELAELHRTYEWVHEGEPSPTIDAALAILADRLPREEEVVLNWGDARIGNILFATDSLEVNALLDWEMATIASPELDLGWFLHMDRFFEEGLGLGKLDGFQSREELIARYEELTGRSVRHVDFYEAFAATRNAILTMRVGRIMIEAGAVPPDSSMPMTNPASMFLATMLDLPSPRGESTYFMDNR